MFTAHDPTGEPFALPSHPDPFDQVSIYCRDRIAPDRHHAKDMSDILAGRADDWCVCRFVEKGGPATHGWPLRVLMGSKLRYGLDAYGSDVSAAVAWFSEADARSVAAEFRSHIAFDRPVHLSKMTWRTILYSSYDGSHHVLYRGPDYGLAELALGAATMVAARNGGVYLSGVLEGVVALDALSAELPEGSSGLVVSEDDPAADAVDAFKARRAAAREEERRLSRYDR